MATGYSVVPIENQQANQTVLKFLADEMVFLPRNLPEGRFPTTAELRDSILDLGYGLEEGKDWYVTSENDFTEIWFKGETSSENVPTEFWFRRGDLILLDIAQSVTNRCGSLAIVSDSGLPTVLLVPNQVFPTLQYKASSGFIAIMSQRIPVMLERLANSSLDETLFILSQIRQTLRRLDHFHHHEIFQSAQQGLSLYKRLLNHEDTHMRYLAFDLIVTFPERFYENADAINLSIRNETNADTKEQMIYAIQHLITLGWIGSEIKTILNCLLELSDNTTEPLPIRFAATNMLTKSQPGILTTSMHTILADVTCSQRSVPR